MKCPSCDEEPSVISGKCPCNFWSLFRCDFCKRNNFHTGATKIPTHRCPICAIVMKRISDSYIDSNDVLAEIERILHG